MTPYFSEPLQLPPIGGATDGGMGSSVFQRISGPGESQAIRPAPGWVLPPATGPRSERNAEEER